MRVVAPFFTSGPIPTALSARHLHGYEEERRTLVQMLGQKTPARIGVFGPRRGGKTSILLSVAPQMPQPRAFLDCTLLWPRAQATFYRWLGEALEIDGKGRPPVLGAPAEAYKALPVPGRKGRGVLVLDNADALEEIDGALLTHLPTLLERLAAHVVLTGPRRALEGLVELGLELRPFSEGTAGDFLRSRFRRMGLEPDEEALAVAFEFSGGSPEALQRIGYAVGQSAALRDETQITRAAVEAAISDAVESLPTETVAAWAALKGLTRDIFIAMAVHNLESPTAIARVLGLEPKNVVVLLSRLEDVHGLVARVGRGTYRVLDPLLKHYVRKRWSSPLIR